MPVFPNRKSAFGLAPLILRDAAGQAQEVTILLDDSSFTPPAEVLARITPGAAVAGRDMAALGRRGSHGDDGQDGP